jgi:ligand-binding SRPBCC domain-containing protein
MSTAAPTMEMIAGDGADEPIRIERAGDRWRLSSRQLVARPLAEVFPFYADAFNLETITPPFLRFRVLTPGPIGMRAGVTIDYALRLRGVPIRWRSEIPVWAPPTRFVDRQVRGPYALWHHEHRFEEVPGGTLVIDEVEYRLPLGVLGSIANAALVKRDLRRIFEYRRARIAERFA